MSERVTLSLDGIAWGGWTSVRINRGIEQLAGAFELALTDRWPSQPERRPITPGAACREAIGGETVITGYLDVTRPSYDSSSHAISVSGRDAAGDLIDCTPLHTSGEFQEATATEIAAAIAAPFGIAVRAEVEVGERFKSFVLQPGNTAQSEIERLCRNRALLAISDGQGGILLTRAGSAAVPDRLERGRNILRASASYDHSKRHAPLIIRGQQPGADDRTPDEAAEVEGRASDPAVRRHRPLVVIAEEPGRRIDYGQRAAWEVSHRAGRGIRADITVQGWRHAGGALWQPNTLVEVRDDWLGLDQMLLIVSVAFRLDQGGTLTDLELAPREAFDQLPAPREAGY